MDKIIIEIYGRPTEDSDVPVLIRRKEVETMRQLRRFRKKWKKRPYDAMGIPYTMYTHKEKHDMSPVRTGIHVFDKCMQIT